MPGPGGNARWGRIPGHPLESPAARMDVPWRAWPKGHLKALDKCGSPAPATREPVPSPARGLHSFREAAVLRTGRVYRATGESRSRCPSLLQGASSRPRLAGIPSFEFGRALDCGGETVIAGLPWSSMRVRVPPLSLRPSSPSLLPYTSTPEREFDGRQNQTSWRSVGGLQAPRQLPVLCGPAGRQPLLPERQELPGYRPRMASAGQAHIPAQAADPRQAGKGAVGPKGPAFLGRNPSFSYSNFPNNSLEETP